MNGPLENRLVAVTDHALVRYLERVHGFQAGTVRSAIAAEVASSAALAIGLGLGRSYSVEVGGVRYLLQDRTVVTVLDRHGTPPNLHRGAP